MVIGEIAAQKCLEMAFTKDNSVIQTLPANAPNDALHIGVLPGAPRCDGTLLYSQTANAFSKVISIECISITQQVLGRRLPWKSLDELLRRPFGSRMGIVTLIGFAARSR